MTQATYSALAVTGAEDYVEGFVVSGFDDAALRALKVPPQGHGPLGNMRQDGLPVRLEDVSQHAQAFGFPPKHPGDESAPRTAHLLARRGARRALRNGPPQRRTVR